MTRTGQGNLQYAVDIVLCIDVTDSMWPVLDTVKKSAMSFHRRLDTVMAEKGKAISQFRLRVIAFRDFGDHAESAIEQTGFFVFPDQASEFDAFVRGLLPLGGGDLPESGLEALALAIRSPWERGLDRRRHIIVMFTDAAAHPLGDPRSRAAHTYPPEIPASLDELFEQWGYASSREALMENSAKRLVLFAPDMRPWSDLVEEWNQTLLFPSAAGEGLEEFEMDEIINTIVNSL
ncbi:VWA domain-containing protein [Actinomadura graeca]|uniref:VWA domain-containing protein n=1 Tax=Actinomadura graeca TaxID=2750812 RepID=A0ABX8QWW2_9ACTN|nr:vWA domain-containing protein [Actinomadura graeca]QXJ22222.1 VWA domain-containing protein [Actinomadura graeca]